MGVGIAFDDYGTGYASLTMLKAFPVSRLKIDRSFVSGPGCGTRDVAIVAAISNLAAAFDLEVIAEGIETGDQHDLMRPFCAEGQGYLFGKPMPADAFSAALAGGEAGGRRVA
jgi:EAL domain-containing protein (putative c-di-GMP-specific phosphodiesterase class I)